MHLIKSNFFIKRNFVIIIPSRQIDKNLKYCVSKIRAFYKNIEILIVLDDLKNKFFFERDKNIKLLLHKNKIGNKRNFASKKTNKKYLVFIDSDTYPLNHWLNYSLKNLKRFNIVCGPNISSNNESLEKKLISTFRKLFFVTYDIDFKIKSKKSKIVSFAPACNLIIKRSLYIKCNGMQENINSAEENYLMQRLKHFNKSILFDGKMFINHKERTVKSFFFQRANYGSSIIDLIKNKIFIRQTIMALLSSMPFVTILLLPLVFVYKYFIFYFIFYLISLISLYFYTLFKLRKYKSIFLKSLIFIIGIYGTGIGLIWNIIFGNVIKYYKHNIKN